MGRAGSGGFDLGLVLSNMVLLATLGLSAVAWIIAFIGQIAAEADGHRQGVLWFNIFLQLFLILGITATLATDSLALARLQISAFLAVALVFAVVGIDNGIYSGISSLQAVTAGWFILTITDILLLLFFTAEEDSAVYSLFAGFGNGRLSGPGGRTTSRSNGGVGISRTAHGSNSGGYGGSFAGGMQSVGNGYQPTYNAPSAADITQGGMGGMPKSQTALNGGGSIRSGNGGVTMGSAAAGPKSDISHGGEGLGGLGSPGSKVGGNDSTNGEPMPGYGYRARALYAYTANADDPTEISFAKGEVLDIVDNSGKWWQARKSNGETGIVPSNYMQVL